MVDGPFPPFAKEFLHVLLRSSFVGAPVPQVVDEIPLWFMAGGDLTEQILTEQCTLCITAETEIVRDSTVCELLLVSLPIFGTENSHRFSLKIGWSFWFQDGHGFITARSDFFTRVHRPITVLVESDGQPLIAAPKGFSHPVHGLRARVSLGAPSHFVRMPQPPPFVDIATGGGNAAIRFVSAVTLFQLHVAESYVRSVFFEAIPSVARHRQALSLLVGADRSLLVSLCDSSPKGAPVMS